MNGFRLTLGVFRLFARASVLFEPVLALFENVFFFLFPHGGGVAGI
jgi:hypothetical protein